jgi:hypothetical protein
MEAIGSRAFVGEPPTHFLDLEESECDYLCQGCRAWKRDLRHRLRMMKIKSIGFEGRRPALGKDRLVFSGIQESMRKKMGRDARTIKPSHNNRIELTKFAPSCPLLTQRSRRVPHCQPLTLSAKAQILQLIRELYARNQNQKKFRK